MRNISGQGKEKKLKNNDNGADMGKWKGDEEVFI